MEILTVILPAAGKGSRLGLPYSKEIMNLEEKKALIDYSFDLFRHRTKNEVEFVVIINENKTDLFKYLSKYKDKFKISFTYQDSDKPEYTGAIKSAYHLFNEKNIVILPDTQIKLAPDIDLYDTVINNLKNNKFFFLYKKEIDQLMLTTKGSLIIKNGLVKAYNDKPTKGISDYNAFWCGFAFTKQAFPSSIEFMEKSTLKKDFNIDDIKLTPIYNSIGIEVEDYIDLGSWASINKFCRKSISD